MNQRPHADEDSTRRANADEANSSDVPAAASTLGKMPESATTNALVGASVPKIVPFRDLARCGDEIWIENEGQIYRLRKTKQGKLILTK